jgi:hypothetical protein
MRNPNKMATKEICIHLFGVYNLYALQAIVSIVLLHAGVANQHSYCEPEPFARIAAGAPALFKYSISPLSTVK